jgi:glycolate oxidase iron-sulfur subunit
MRTSFSPAQLGDPEIAEANGILETCVHYGFCTNTCPTYVLTRDENESPRGRIDLIRAMLERGGAPEVKTVRHLDHCLSCLSCMTTCAVKVDYAHLIDRARVHIERHYRRPWADRLVRLALAKLLPYPRRFAAALRAGRAVKPLARWLPRRWRPLIEMIPTPRDTRAEILAPQVFAAELFAAEISAAERPRRRRVALLAGCAQQALDGAINAATVRLLTRRGCEVVIAPGAGCCGSLALHMGREADARAAARTNVQAWTRLQSASGLDAIVINASGCGTTVKDYGHLLARDPDWAEPARRIAALARDVSEVVSEIGLAVAQAPAAYRVAYHDPCSMQHGQRVTREPRDLLRAAGFVVVGVPEAHFCCGSAGTYNLLQPDMAAALGRRKAAHIAGVDPDMVATGNIGCMMQLRRYLAVPLVHTVELLDWATGGPQPPALANVSLRTPAPPAVTGDGAGAGASSSDTGFW